SRPLARDSTVGPMRLTVLLLLAVGLVVGQGAIVRAAAAQNAAAQNAPAQPGVRHTVAFEGLGDAGELDGLVRQSSALVARIEDLPPSRAGLRRRADSDLDRFAAAAHSLGYYDAAFTARIEAGGAADAPLVVTVTAEPGARYHISSVEIVSVDGAPPVPGDLPERRIGLAKGAPARSADVIGAEAAVLRLLQERGHPLARVADRTALI